ncbi:MAG: GlgC family sugar phosphate nucleotidyltransferase [Promethearchaeota archaeon]|jgi:NDP-sugar pyrophosphorylase family protein
MKNKINELGKYLNESDADTTKILGLMSNILKEHVNGLKIDNYIGDYPTFMEPVILGDKVKIGDDVLIGPKVYIGSNSEIEDYVEISNSIIFDNVKIGSNCKIKNCIIVENCKLNFTNSSFSDSILRGVANTEDELELTPF